MPLGHALHRYIPMLKGIVIWAFGVMLWSTPAFGDSGRPPWQKGSLIFEHKRNLPLFIQGYILSELYVVWHFCLCFAQHQGLQRYSQVCCAGFKRGSSFPRLESSAAAKMLTEHTLRHLPSFCQFSLEAKLTMGTGLLNLQTISPWVMMLGPCLGHGTKSIQKLLTYETHWKVPSK